MKINTVRGDIDPSELGYTTMHEHTITDMTQLVTAQQMYSASFGYTGFTGFSVNAIPKLYEMMDIIDAEDIDRMVYDNPARILAY